jgi:hypothetical protein
MGRLPFRKQISFRLIERDSCPRGSFLNLSFDKWSQSPARANRIASYIGPRGFKRGHFGQTDDPLLRRNVSGPFFALSHIDQIQ